MKFALPEPLRVFEPYLVQMGPYAAALGGFAALGLLMGVIEINTSIDSKLSKEPWSLPPTAKTQVTPPDEDDIAARFWVEGPQAAKKKKVEEKKTPLDKWTFVGTVDHGQGLVGVVVIEGKGVRNVRSGEALPDGTKITDVSDGSLSFEREGQARTIRLFAENKPE
ncbi:MAG: hypothetical protein JNK21_11510 [Rhodospirillaceae bacterium]|nr:hypothetical protein [Rhodospirillaceae bacterium]